MFGTKGHYRKEDFKNPSFLQEALAPQVPKCLAAAGTESTALRAAAPTRAPTCRGSDPRPLPPRPPPPARVPEARYGEIRTDKPKPSPARKTRNGLSSLHVARP
ncbi:uncharacterized protein WM277_001455 [Molossus nigricans]